MGCSFSRFADTFVLRWDFKVDQSEFLNAVKGEEVHIVRYEDGASQTMAVVKKKRGGRKARGLVPPEFLMPKPETAEQFDAVSRSAESGRWFAGYRNPVRASMVLRSEGAVREGMYVVCAPIEYQCSWIRHPDFLLLVRTYSESDQTVADAWRRQCGNVFSLKKDLLPGSLDPVPGVACLRIRRTSNGCYYIYSKRTHFRTLFDLLNSYANCGEALLVDMAVAPRLSIPAPLSVFQSVPPPPLLLDEAQTAVERRPARPLIGGTCTSKSCSHVDRVAMPFVGRGTFGRVYEGSLHCRDRVGLLAAVKVVDRDISRFCEAEWQKLAAPTLYDTDFLAEYFYHVTNNEGESVVIAEYFPLGSLDDALRKRAVNDLKLTLRGLLELLYQVCGGMMFLETIGLQHRHLTAGNVFVVEESRFTVSIKIADYLVSSAALEDADFRKRRELDNLPYRWMAIESLLSGTFTIKSDMWSFGVVAFEVLSHGRLPYDGFAKAATASELLQFLESGGRLPLDGALVPPYMSDVLRACWRRDADRRPTFASLYRFFDRLLFDDVFGPHRALKMTHAHRSASASPSSEAAVTADELEHTPTQPAGERATTSEPLDLDKTSRKSAAAKSLTARKMLSARPFSAHPMSMRSSRPFSMRGRRRPTI